MVSDEGRVVAGQLGDEWLGRDKAGVDEEVAEELGELLDLAEFVGHAVAGLAAVVGDAESTQPGRRGGNQVALGAIVRRRCCRRGRGLLHAQTGGTVGLAFELGSLGGRKEVRVEEVGANERLD